jgi:D-glycero-D-manno-heptose 1,7-bisphosphate phosphatase
MLFDLILFDRDGTLNHRNPTGFVTKPNQLKFPADIGSLKELRSENIGIVTNQSCINRGIVNFEEAHSLTWSLKTLFNKDIEFNVFICPHLPESSCDCRKPRAGLIKQALTTFSVIPSRTLFVGDSLSDLEAADAGGIHFRAVCWDFPCWSNKCLHTLTHLISYANQSQTTPEGQDL